MTDLRTTIDELRRLEQAATPPPWMHAEEPPGSSISRWLQTAADDLASVTGGERATEADFALIAAARNSLSALLDAAERSLTLEASVQRLLKENACMLDRLRQLGAVPITKSQERRIAGTLDDKVSEAMEPPPSDESYPKLTDMFGCLRHLEGDSVEIIRRMRDGK